MTKIQFIQAFPPELNSYEVGKSRYFDLKKYCEVIEMMILSDEVTSALWMCDNPPGWWRDKHIPEIAEIKKTLLARTFDAVAYSNYEDISISPEEIGKGMHAFSCFPRAEVIASLVKDLNDKNEVPFIYEIGPCSGWLPFGLQNFNRSFNYSAQSLNSKVIDYLKTHVTGYADRPKSGQKTIFVCYEILEHLKDPDDLEHWLARSGIDFDYVLISTPRYTWDMEGKNWREMQLGHLRTWTPSEFIAKVTKIFKNYSWTFYDSFGMVMKGERA